MDSAQSGGVDASVQKPGFNVDENSLADQQTFCNVRKGDSLSGQSNVYGPA